MTKKSGPLLPMSAVACYQKTTGLFLGVVRLRLLEALPREVGRHAFEPTFGDTRPVRPDLQWRPSPEVPDAIARELEGLFSNLSCSESALGLLENLVAGGGTLEHPGSGRSEERTDVVFLECYPWEKPRRLLDDALRALVFHGKAIREDLRKRLEGIDGASDSLTLPKAS